MKPSATASAAQSCTAGITAKNATWTAAAVMNTGRGPNRSSRLPTTSWAIDATAQPERTEPAFQAGPDILQPLGEDLRQGEGCRLEDNARNRRRQEHDHRDAPQQ